MENLLNPDAASPAMRSYVAEAAQPSTPKGPPDDLVKAYKAAILAGKEAKTEALHAWKTDFERRTDAATFARRK